MKPKIFAFSNVRGGDVQAYGMAEDGTILADHWCSNEAWVPNDLGVTSGRKHEEYRKHYPDGFEVEFVLASEVLTHAGLKRAFELNQQQAGAAKLAQQHNRPPAERAGQQKGIMSNETPEDKARRIGVPLIPKNNRPCVVPMDTNRTVSVCGECGLEIKQVMGYCCPKGNCPARLGGSISMCTDLRPDVKPDAAPKEPT